MYPLSLSSLKYPLSLCMYITHSPDPLKLSFILGHVLGLYGSAAAQTRARFSAATSVMRRLGSIAARYQAKSACIIHHIHMLKINHTPLLVQLQLKTRERFRNHNHHPIK